MKKLLASVVIVAVLGLQMWTILPPGRRGQWYWPFLEYPMYSNAHHATDSVRLSELWLKSCAPGARAKPVTDSLGIPLVRFRELLSDARSTRAASRERDSSIALLNEAIAYRSRDRICTAEIVSRFVPVATYDWNSRPRLATSAVEWTVPVMSRR